VVGAVTSVAPDLFTRSEILTVAPQLASEPGAEMRVRTDSAFDSEPWLAYALREHAGGRSMKLKGVYKGANSIQRMLRHLGEPTESPAPLPPATLLGTRAACCDGAPARL
jgi:hypothetical protein